jgi:copper homeostasis protein CutC
VCAEVVHELYAPNLLRVHHRFHPKVQVHVLIRPRLGDFVYSEEEMQVILSDIRSAGRVGATGMITSLLQSVE